MFRRIQAQIRKELTQILRDRLALTLALALPLILLFLLSFALSLSVSRIPLVVQDLDGSLPSQRYLDAFRASITFRVVSLNLSERPENALQSGRARAALIIPRSFGRDVMRRSATPVQLLVDATDANTAKLVASYANQITASYNKTSGSSSPVALVRAETRLWFNPGLSSPKFYAPGIFVLALSMFPPLLASIAMSKETEQKTILQVYVSNISAHEFLVGKLGAFTIVALCEWAFTLAIMVPSFGLHFAGDPTPLIVSSILYCICVSAFGCLVGAGIPSQAASIQVISIGGFLLVFLLSGLLFPIQNIPLGLRWISNLVWGRYYIEILRDALLQGGGWPAVYGDVIAIGLIGGIFYFLTWRILRKMQVDA